MNTTFAKSHLNVAGLHLLLEADVEGSLFTLPACHKKFVDKEGNLGHTTEMTVAIHTDGKIPEGMTGVLVCATDIWDLLRGEQGELIFVTKKNSNQRTLIVQPNFTRADLFWEQSRKIGALSFPLDNLDLLMLVNWLAEWGELALHASGVVLDGKGYAFLGESGAGKSTLAAALQKDHQASVLGEDQVILRYSNDEFWIYGTPWHENPNMCSPDGNQLSALFFLDRIAEPGLNRISAIEGVSRIMQTAFVPYYRPELIPLILENLTRLAKKVPFYCLNYPLGQDVFTDYLQNL